MKASIEGHNVAKATRKEEMSKSKDKQQEALRLFDQCTPAAAAGNDPVQLREGA